jgi:DNA adenine methylase
MESMSEWEIVNGSYEKVPVRKGDFVFADPPYDLTFNDYTSEGFSWDDQVRLATHLRDLSTESDASVIATNSSTPRIIELYRDLGFTVTIESAPRRVSPSGNRDRVNEMVAYLNLQQKVPDSQQMI